MTPVERVQAALAAHGSRQQGRDWTCPAHPDQRASLSVAEGRDGKVVLKCHAGCRTEDVLATLGLGWADLFPSGRNGKAEIVVCYDYTDEQGRLLYQSVRYFPKDFRRRRPDGNGGWIWGLKDTTLVPYRLPKVLAAVEAGQPIYVVEGEKDVHAVERAGATATTNLGGADGIWPPSFSRLLAKTKVVVVADNDDPGRKRARRVAASIQDHGGQVEVVRPAPGHDKADAADHLNAGHGLKGFLPLDQEPEPTAVAQDGVAVIRVANVQPEPVEWLWRPRIPRGMLTVFDGDPGLGKSTICLELTARVTTGSPMPGSTTGTHPANVVLLSAEDVIAQVIRPRLEAAGADCNRVVVFDHVNDGQGPRSPELPADTVLLERIVDVERAALVIVDPLMAFFGAEVNAHRDQDVRRALHALKALAERTGAAVLVVRHLNKAGGSNPLYRGGGSIGIVGAARSGLLVAPDPEDGQRRILAASKSNLAPAPASLAYRVATDELHNTARIVWEGETAHRAADLLRGPADHDLEAPAREGAEEFLRDLLAEGPMPTKTLQRLARDAGIAWRTVERAKATLGVVAERVGKPGPKGDAAYYWQPPSGGPTPAPPPDGGPTPEAVSAGQSDAGESEWSSSASSAKYTEVGGPTPLLGLDGGSGHLPGVDPGDARRFAR